MGASEQQQLRETGQERRIEFFAAVILSLATALTAWCGYQSARWGGE
jgi:hypothetical protein